MTDDQLSVVMRGITKRFPGVIANDSCNLEVKRGEIHALLGENGAGKTTLMNILYGIYQQDEGEIFINGKQVHIHSPQDSINLGIGMVHQHFRLVETHTVTENIILGMSGGLRFNQREIQDKIRELAEKYQLEVDPKARIWQLSAGEQQRVEILKALYRGAEILILDEPTSMLTPTEIGDLLKTLHRMTEEGQSIIFITHKLDEVTSVSHRVTVLKHGKAISTLETASTSREELARLMVGREVIFRLHKEPGEIGDKLLEIENLQAENDKGLPALKGINLKLRAGEILGVAGVAGNGQRELVEALIGLRPVTNGSIFLSGIDITRLSTRQRIDRGLACIPSERGRALVPNMSIAENLILKNYRKPPISQGAVVDYSNVNKYADRLINEYQVKTPSRETPMKLLSGGNIQRALLAREISTEPDVLIAATPTGGLDVGATETVWKLLLEQRKHGRTVLLISEDLDEVMTLADRIAVLYEGEIMGILPGEEKYLDQIGLMMAGALRIPVEDWS